LVKAIQCKKEDRDTDTKCNKFVKKKPIYRNSSMFKLNKESNFPQKPVLRIWIRDPVPFYPKDPGWFFFRIPDLGSRILTTSQIQDFTLKNGEKQEKFNFV
jgi:hypothetical protein